MEGNININKRLILDNTSGQFNPIVKVKVQLGSHEKDWYYDRISKDKQIRELVNDMAAFYFNLGCEQAYVSLIPEQSTGTDDD